MYYGPSRAGVLRSSLPASNAQATAKIRCLGDVPERTILVRCLLRASRSPEPRPAEGGHLGACGASGATGCFRYLPTQIRGGRGRRDRCALFATYLTHPPLLTVEYARKRKDRPDEAHHSVVGHHGPDPAGGKRVGTGGGG